MPMLKLVIAEKPSVAVSIANVIGADKKCKGYREGNGYIVSWCIGHLAELCYPESYDERYAKWYMDDLPIVPDVWKYRLDGKKKEQFNILKTLMNRSDVSEVINACDAGREGERIFRTIYRITGCRKPMKRLWISSLEDEAVREGFKNLKPGKEYDSLYDAAECRAKADWLVGMNISRLLTLAYGKTYRAGRVMSPTLAFITERQDEINSFKPESFFIVELKGENISLVSDKFKTKEEAEDLKQKCLNEPVVYESAVSEEHREKAPKLYDLTSLQRDANRVYGFTAQQTLDYTQSLYERKLCTYVRTDSMYLTDDMEETAEKLFSPCSSVLKIVSDLNKLNASVLCDSRKVSDHHAIIPTVSIDGYDLTSLPQGEKKIIFLVMKRLLEAASDDYIYETVTYNFTRGECEFKAKQTFVKQLGWKLFEGKEAADDKPFMFKVGESLKGFEVQVKEGKTKPKKEYTEDTLLSAMETAGKGEIPDDAERQGIGTPATRAEVIEKLISSGYVRREGKKLIPDEKGINLVSVLPESLKSASLTAEWEHKLKQVEKGELSPESFMESVTGFISGLIDAFKKEKSV
jgi:DNA topoisomerase-3